MAEVNVSVSQLPDLYFYLTRTPALQVSGRVVDGEGKPVVGASLTYGAQYEDGTKVDSTFFWVFTSGDRMSDDKTDSDGKFQVFPHFNTASSTHGKSGKMALTVTVTVQGVGPCVRSNFLLVKTGQKSSATRLKEKHERQEMNQGSANKKRPMELTTTSGRRSKRVKKETVTTPSRVELQDYVKAAHRVCAALLENSIHLPDCVGLSLLCSCGIADLARTYPGKPPDTCLATLASVATGGDLFGAYEFEDDGLPSLPFGHDATAPEVHASLDAYEGHAHEVSATPIAQKVPSNLADALASNNVSPDLFNCIIAAVTASYDIVAVPASDTSVAAPSDIVAAPAAAVTSVTAPAAATAATTVVAAPAAATAASTVVAAPAAATAATTASNDLADPWASGGFLAPIGTLLGLELHLPIPQVA
jgi:hypothetical protein